jgi:DNA-binding beta-propeller fold protein YncE
MKRTKKLLVLAVIIGCVAGIGLVLTKMVQHAGEPFSGARVVIDDAAWQSMMYGEEATAYYQWVESNTLLGYRSDRGGWHTTLYRILPDGTSIPLQSQFFAVSPRLLPFSLSPNGKTLSILAEWKNGVMKYRLVRLDKQEKPVTLMTEPNLLHWSHDSRFLYRGAESDDDSVLLRIDARTGAVVKTPINLPEGMGLAIVTPDGKLLFYAYDTNDRVDSQMQKWRIGELQGNTVHSKAYQKRFPPDTLMVAISPDGKRLLWRVENAENTFWERIQNKVLRKKIAPKGVLRWQITDIDGTHAQTIGAATEEMKQTLISDPQWTPDSKSVHFVMDKKLWRLDVP